MAIRSASSRAMRSKRFSLYSRMEDRRIGGWLEGGSPWFTMAEALGGRVAKLIGAEPDEVAIANSMTINLHQLLATVYRPDSKRKNVLIDAHTFPTDRYALRSHLRLRGFNPDEHIVVVPDDESRFLDESRIDRAFARAAKASGAAGVLVVDLPPEASSALHEQLRRQNIDLISRDAHHLRGAAAADRATGERFHLRRRAHWRDWHRA